MIVPLSETEKADALKKFIASMLIGPGLSGIRPRPDFSVPLPAQVVATDKKADRQDGGQVEAGALGTRFCGPAGAHLPDRIGDPLLRAPPASRRRSPSSSWSRSPTMVVHLASPAISKFGLGFLTTNDWNPVTERFGAAPFIYGTAVTSAIALLFAAPLSIAISIYLTELAPSRLRRPVATLVDMLAAIPSVILGLWGILVLGPFMHDTIEPALKSVLGFLPIFSGDPSAFGYLTAVLILHEIMTSADHHQRHPRGLRDRAR